MKVLSVFVSLILTTLFMMGQNNSNKSIKLTDLAGKWYINQTNFPMWLTGKRTNPTFNYTIITNKNSAFLKDEVRFIKNGQSKSIKGISKPNNSANTQFIWRGTGLLKLLKSKWEIIYFDEVAKFGIIYFEKTLFTPEGYDVISRDKRLESSVEQAIRAIFESLEAEHKITTLLH